MRAYSAAALFAVLLAAVPSSALFFTGAVSQTLGRHDYAGTSAWADFGGDLHLRPSYMRYSFEGSHGTFHSYGARLGYDLPILGLGVSAGAVPKTDGYSNYSVGADAVLSLSPSGSGPVRRIKGADQGGGKARGKGLARVDVSGGVAYTGHRDELDASRTARSSVEKLGQTDLNAGVGVSFLSNLLSADFVHSDYDRRLTASDRGGRFVVLPGVASVFQEYPKNTVHFKAELGMLPVVHPYAGYSRTVFQRASPEARAYTAGVYLELMMLEATAFYQRLVRTGPAPDESFYGLGASLRL